jgi:DNA-binding transcriptional LysR family regulator
MRKKLPPLNWFRAFECAARHLSFTAAALELGLTQSAISQQVRLLEQRFSVLLFIRLPRGLALTDAGRRILPNVTDSISGLGRIAAAFEPGQSKNTLTIAASISFAQSFIIPNLSNFLDDNPTAQIRIKSTLWPDDYMSSDADVEIRFGSSESVGQGSKELYQDRIVLVCAPGMLGDAPSWTDICNARRIQIVGTSETWEKWSNEFKLDPPKSIAQLVDSHGLAIDLARCGTGVALTSYLLATPSLIEGTLVMPLKESILAVDQYFISIKKDQTNTLAQTFSLWLHSEVSKASKSGLLTKKL